MWSGGSAPPRIDVGNAMRCVTRWGPHEATFPVPPISDGSRAETSCSGRNPC